MCLSYVFQAPAMFDHWFEIWGSEGLAIVLRVLKYTQGVTEKILYTYVFELKVHNGGVL